MPLAFVHPRNHQTERVVADHVGIELDLRKNVKVQLHDAGGLTQRAVFVLAESPGDVNRGRAGLTVRTALVVSAFEGAVHRAHFHPLVAERILVEIRISFRSFETSVPCPVKAASIINRVPLYSRLVITGSCEKCFTTNPSMWCRRISSLTFT